MYKAFTLERYRGQRLHAAGVTRALEYYRAKGFRGLVSYVESNNFDSLKSSYRMGYRQCGRIRVMRLAGRYFVYREPECKLYGLKVSPAYLFKQQVHAPVSES
jgi:L-amino acid N-acyltransferase YncA